ncbi:hypothetical protein B0H34DRAFT_528693 [Crassisporium funariophilum]|nr:hypothetical protein B0H34DRAFT_528693 [Crassisporium funariophilum]
MQTSRYYALKEGNLDPPSLSNMYPPSSSGTHYPSTVTLGTDEDLKSPDTEYDSRWSDILHGGSSIRKFSRLISALDLSTTPYGIQQAQIRCTRTKIHDTPPTPLVHLMESYRLPYPGSLTFLKSFEARTLLRFIRPDSQSQSILIRYDGSLIRRRVLPIIPKPPPPIARIMNKIYGEFNAFRSFEGLDLAGGQREKAYMDNESWKNVQFTFHRPPRWKAIFSQIPLFFIAAISGFALLYAGFHLFFFPFGSVERRLCIVVQSKYPCEISPNPDVAGVGGRAALYLQTFIASVLLTFSRKGAIPASWALLVTSTAFTLTALVSTATHQLTLYHVTIVAKMQGLPLVVLTIVEVFPPRIRGPYMFLLIRIRLLSARV